MEKSQVRHEQHFEVFSRHLKWQVLFNPDFYSFIDFKLVDCKERGLGKIFQKNWLYNQNVRSKLSSTVVCATRIVLKLSRASGMKDHFDTNISCVMCFLADTSFAQIYGSDFKISAFRDRIGVILPLLNAVFDAHSDGIFRFFSKNFPKTLSLESTIWMQLWSNLKFEIKAKCFNPIRTAHVTKPVSKPVKTYYTQTTSHFKFYEPKPIDTNYHPKPEPGPAPKPIPVPTPAPLPVGTYNRETGEWTGNPVPYRSQSIADYYADKERAEAQSVVSQVADVFLLF